MRKLQQVLPTVSVNYRPRWNVCYADHKYTPRLITTTQQLRTHLSSPTLVVAAIHAGEEGEAMKEVELCKGIWDAMW